MAHLWSTAATGAFCHRPQSFLNNIVELVKIYCFVILRYTCVSSLGLIEAGVQKNGVAV